MTGKPKQIEKHRALSRPVKQISFKVQNSQLSKYCVIFVPDSRVICTLLIVVGL